MANKRINDLQARSSFDDTCNVAVDDASQSWRVTGAQIKAAIRTAIAPLVALGDMIYGGAAGATTILSGNTTATPMVLTQTGTGTVSAAPAWVAPTPPVLRLASKTAAYTLTATDDFVRVNSTSGAFALTLPAATGTGKVYHIKNIGTANAVTVTRAGSDTIDGATTYVLSVQYEAITIVDAASGVWSII